uniref:Uncharacterized protein n=1 Tax=Guillardia theta TaxID=55529 RepID=A0A7S4JFL7_GUITH
MPTRPADDSTALHISVFHGKDTTTKKLVQLGASLTSINKHKHNALDLAEYRRWPELANFLRTEMKLPPSETDWDDEEQKFREVKQQCIDRMATELERRMRSEMQLDEGHEGPANPPKLHPKAENEIRKIIEGHAHEEALTLMRKKK